MSDADMSSSGMHNIAGVLRLTYGSPVHKRGIVDLFGFAGEFILSV